MPRRLFSPSDRRLVEAVSVLTFANPFLRERIDAERAVLGDDFLETDLVWSMRPPADVHRPNIPMIRQRVELLVDAARRRILNGLQPGADETGLYEDAVLYLMYSRYWEVFHNLIVEVEGGRTARRRLAVYEDFTNDLEHYLALPGLKTRAAEAVPLAFAIFFQIRRAFHYLFYTLVGSSMAAARLRAAAWQSIFTCDMRRYYRILFDRMADHTTLITGPSGTGKELVARAIALSRYIPFDPKARTFADDHATLFHAVNLSALSPTLIESELFGHRRGAFTGAIEDYAGWLETCPPRGTVFLDEIGELDARIQIKLLRVLQSRTFQRLGDTRERRFAGKIVAATNRDLAAEMAAGAFRRDFYYRLCSDIIETPSLADQLRENPGDRRSMVLFIAHRLVGDEAEALTDQVEGWIDAHLPPAYKWPGNFRELEQCVRNILIRQDYRPVHEAAPSAADALANDLRAGALTADKLLQRYCTLVHAQTGSYIETARRLGLDRRTVKAKLNPHPEATS